MPATVILEKRCQIQPPGRPGVDRLVRCFTGEPDEAQRRQFGRCVAIRVGSRMEALKAFAEFHALAKSAVARHEVTKFLDEIDRREDTPRDDGITFDVFSEQWETTVLLTGGHPDSEVETTRRILKNHLRPFFGKHKLRDITPRMIDEFKTLKREQEHQFGAGFAASTINAHLSVLNRVYTKAVEYELVIASPVRPSAWMRRERTPEDSTNWWTTEEAAKAIARLRSDWRTTQPDRYRPMVIQIPTGIRIGELRVLQPRDLELDGTVPGFWVRRSMASKTVGTPKNGHARFVPIPRELVPELREWTAGREPDGLLFPGKQGGPIRNNVINRWYAKLAEEVGIRRISSHGARHTTGSTLAFMGVGQKVIGAALGHRDSKATERYTHVEAGTVAPLTEARWLTMTGGMKPTG